MSVARVGVSYRELDSNDIMVSRSLASLLGLPPGTPSISRDDFLARVHHDDVDRVRTAVGEAVARGSEFDLEYRLRRPEGGWRWFRSNGRVTSSRPGPAGAAVQRASWTSPRAARWRCRSSRPRRWMRSASSPEAWRTTSTICSPRCVGTPSSCSRRRPEPEQRHHAQEIVKAARRAATLTKQLLAFSRRQVRADGRPRRQRAGRGHGGDAPADDPRRHRPHHRAGRGPAVGPGGSRAARAGGDESRRQRPRRDQRRWDDSDRDRDRRCSTRSGIRTASPSSPAPT